MYYYLTCFIVSAFLFWIGQYLKLEKKAEPIRWLIYGIAILIPAVLAGVRDDSVGTDMLVYGVPVFDAAVVASDFGVLINNIYCDRIDKGYLLLNYIVAQITHNQIYFFGLIMFIEVLCVFLFLRQWQKKIPIWLAMLVFYFMFYNLSLNAMRQCLSLSIMFLGIRYVFERKFFRFAFWVVVGILFHWSSAMVLLFYPMYPLVKKYNSLKNTLMFLVVGIVLIVFFQHTLGAFLGSLDGIFSRGIYFLVTEDVGERGFALNTLLFYGLITLFFLLNRKRILSQYSNVTYFLQYIAALLLLMPFIDYYGTTYVTRILIPITWWLPVLLVVVFHSFKKIPKIVLNIGIISYCFFYWYMTIIFSNHNETSNYLTIWS